MKKIKFILMLFIFAQTFVFSQKYQPFDSTTVWVANQVNVVCTQCVVGRDVKYFSKGYEINNSRVWNKLYCNDKSYFLLCMTCTWTPLPTNTNKLLGYYTNDTLNKIVYFHQAATLPPNYTPPVTEKLYSFLNKSIGDSLRINNSNFYTFKISGIDSVLFSGKYYKRYQTNCTPPAPPINSSTLSFIEGIGSSLGPFEPLIHPVGDAYSYLNCFASPTQTVTVTSYTALGSGACTNIVLDVKETKEIVSSIYPNPNNGSFKINIENQIDQIVLYNSIGQKVYEQRLNHGTNEIHTDKLSRGLYHYILFQNKQWTSSGKLTVE